MGSEGNWIEKRVPKERCEAEKSKLKAEGFEVKDECLEDATDRRMCIITYRAVYNF